jgi:hypothetical protein
MAKNTHSILLQKKCMGSTSNKALTSGISKTHLLMTSQTRLRVWLLASYSTGYQLKIICNMILKLRTSFSVVTRILQKWDWKHPMKSTNRSTTHPISANRLKSTLLNLKNQSIQSMELKFKQILVKSLCLKVRHWKIAITLMKYARQL